MISRRDIPSVDRLLAQVDDRGLGRYPRAAVTDALRAATDRLRLVLSAQTPLEGDADAWIFREAEALLATAFRPSLRRVVNATGVILHTNLGRALLSEDAVNALTDAAGRYANLELDLATGERGHRSVHVDALLQKLTGAEAAVVTNNNAAAMMLILDELASGREVIVSRGELIEIGGSFRLPDVLRKSGATLVEVGATNKTYLRDYEQAITPQTGLLLKSHQSNFRIVGFTTAPERRELVALGERHNVVVMEDLGSGLMLDLRPYGIPDEPTVQEVVESGMPLLCFSGDKLLGGPQAGIIIGKKSLVDRCKKNPLMRALRVDKLTLASLEATLRAYLDPTTMLEKIPTLRMLSTPLPELENQARTLAARLRELLGDRARVAVEEDASEVGGGTLPARSVPTRVVAVTPPSGEALWEEHLRRQDPPIMARMARGSLLFDVRTLLPGDDQAIVSALKEAP
ncbi:MAG: L-seryl-tRNA(Sec) selenium transferase [Candidatus Xenobia bacterium]